MTYKEKIQKIDELLKNGSWDAYTCAKIKNIVKSETTIFDVCLKNMGIKIDCYEHMCTGCPYYS